MKNDYKVIVDAGHGGDDPGAVANNLLEKELSIADKVKEAKEKSANQTIIEKPKKDKNIEL